MSSSFAMGINLIVLKVDLMDRRSGRQGEKEPSGLLGRATMCAPQVPYAYSTVS